MKATLLGLALLGLASAPPAVAEPAAAPTWYQHKKQVKKEEEAETARKAQEAPALDQPAGQTGPQPVSSLSADTRPPPPTNLLFRREGMTEMLTLDLGKLNQSGSELSELAFALHLKIGWWWLPKLIVGPSVRATGFLKSTHAFMQVTAGPLVRWLVGENWIWSAYAGWGLSNGLNLVPETNIPPPPSNSQLATRRGPQFGTTLAYLFWSRRDFGIGPHLGIWKGSQDERSQFAITLGVGLQSGRPNLRGDLTASE